MQKKYLSQKEINNLKENLMPKKGSKNRKDTESSTHLSNNKELSSKYKSSSLSSEYYKMFNKGIGTNFENNIRQILEIFYGWKKVPLERKALYREIIYDGKSEYVTDIKTKEIILKNKSLIFVLNKDKSLDILFDDKKNTIKAEEFFEFNFLEKKIVIKQTMDMELDGIYENADLDKLNSKEIGIIRKNVHNSKISSFKKVVMEIKLNRNKISELLHQLDKDRTFMECLGEKDYLYVGIVNSKSVNHKDVNEFLNENGDLNFIILGIKNSRFENKDVTQFYDWEEIKKIKTLEKDVIDIKNEVSDFKKEVGDKLGKLEKNVGDRMAKLENEVSDIKNELKVNNDLLRDIKRYLMKKRSRGKGSHDD